MDQNNEIKFNQIFDPIFNIYFSFFARYKILIFLILASIIISTLFVYLNRNISGKLEIIFRINESQLNTLYGYEKDLDYDSLDLSWWQKNACHRSFDFGAYYYITETPIDSGFIRVTVLANRGSAHLIQQTVFQHSFAQSVSSLSW